jgi:uroporphyrinogen-III synthase
MRVLVTRPQPGTARTAQRLRELGHYAVELPLTEIVGVPFEGFSLEFSERPPSAVAITSVNAIRHAPTQLLETLRGLPCYAVGGETATEARAAGFSDVRKGPGSAEALADWIICDPEPHAAIVYLCGRVRLSTFEKRLAEAGLDVHATETYDTLTVVYPPDTLSRVLETEPIDAVLLYSAGAAEHFPALAASNAMIGNPRLLCLSSRVADRLAGIEPSRIRVSAEPTEDALLALL